MTAGSRVPARVLVAIVLAPFLLAAIEGPAAQASHTGIPYWWEYFRGNAAVSLEVEAGTRGFGGFRIEAGSHTLEYALGFFLVEEATGKTWWHLQSSDAHGASGADLGVAVSSTSPDHPLRVLDPSRGGSLLAAPAPASHAQPNWCANVYGHNLILEVAFPRPGTYTIVAFGTGPDPCDLYFRYHDLARTTWGAYASSHETASARVDDFPAERSPMHRGGAYAWDATDSRVEFTAPANVYGAFAARFGETCPDTPKGAIAIEGQAPRSGAKTYILAGEPPGAYAFTVDGSYGWSESILGGPPTCLYEKEPPRLTLFVASVPNP